MGDGVGMVGKAVGRYIIRERYTLLPWCLGASVIVDACGHGIL